MIDIVFFNKRYKLKRYNDYIESIYIFGSSARGEEDNFSDIDVFVLVDECEEELYLEIKKYIADLLEIQIDWVSLYRKSRIVHMHEYGAYFLWHIKKEGIKIFSKTNFMEGLLQSLPLYAKVKDDLRKYRIMCNDIKQSIDKEDTLLSYELSVMALLIRNTCICLCYLNGEFIFGRRTPVEYCKETLPKYINFDMDEYDEIYKFNLYYKRQMNNISLIKPTIELIERWIRIEECLLELASKLEGSRN